MPTSSFRTSHFLNKAVCRTFYIINYVKKNDNVQLFNTLSFFIYTIKTSDLSKHFPKISDIESQHIEKEISVAYPKSF